MGKRRAIKLDSETRRSWPDGGTTGRETKGMQSIGALAEALLLRIGRERKR